MMPHARHGVCDKLECMGSILCVKQLACDLIRIVVCYDIHELAPLKEQRGGLRQPLYTYREKKEAAVAPFPMRPPAHEFSRSHFSLSQDNQEGLCEALSSEC